MAVERVREEDVGQDEKLLVVRDGDRLADFGEEEITTGERRNGGDQMRRDLRDTEKKRLTRGRTF